MKYLSRLRNIYNKHIRHTKKEARFLVLVAFTVTFVLARVIVYGITYHLLPSFPFTYLFYRDVHIHHLVFGIILLLIAGFIRIPEINNDLIRISSLLYGIGAALTLDEFALWLRLKPDAYFGREGRISIDAVVLFVLIILLTLWYGNFLKKIALFTLSFFGLRTSNRQGKKLQILKKLLPYIGLGVFTFIIVVLLLPSGRFFSSQHKMQNKIVTKAIINSNAMKSSSYIASVSATPTLTLTPTSTAAATLSGFCLTIPVLMYHHIQSAEIAQTRGQMGLTVDTTVFEQQMHYLSTNGYTTISAEQLVTALRNHTSLPQKTVVLTFDDAYKDNYTDAFPIAKKYHITLNLMVPTGLLGVHAATNYYFSWDDLHDMVNSGLAYAYNHSWSHFPVGTGTLEKNQFEIMTAKQQLEQNLGKPVNIFTYPYGSGATTPWLTALLQKDGFIGAFSTIGGTVQCDSIIMSLHRTRVGSSYFPGYGIN